MKTTPPMVVLVVVLAVVTAGISAGAVASESTEQVPLGASVSSFMQASAADASASVDRGMHVAELNDSNASERARLIHQRIETLDGRLETLQSDRAAFTPKADGTVTVAERARAAQLAVRANSLVDAINETAASAARAGIPVNQTKLDRLRTEARNMTGQEVAAVATGLVDIDRPGKPGGPPGPPATPGNRKGGQGDSPGNGTGNQAANDATNRSSNASDSNASSGRGNGSDARPEDPGQSGDGYSGDSGGQGDDSGSGQSDDGSGNAAATPGKGS